ncbi:hypothetical protein [Oceanobacillus limi]|uniref:hypothetical protein n=1 Tax=Oceanobacillus limi TaxID=930131 RepID=UPI001FCDE248|nr:hypothetical protein [Oceanobacillus limi]
MGVLFEQESSDKVRTYLATFQNKDGGFGHGIEPDFWLPNSSPMSTWTAGQILLEIDADPNDEIVSSMVSYLTNTAQAETGMWSSVLPENNNYPHAPWWHWEDGVQRNWMFNPGVELAAFLVHWSEEGSEPAATGWHSIEQAVQHVMNTEQMDAHEVNNFQQFLKIISSYATTFHTKIRYSFEDVTMKVLELVEQCMEINVSAWGTGYKALPLDLIDSPNHPLYEKYSEVIEENINFYWNQLSEEGIWDISWSWGNYPEDFPVARRYWQGVLAVNRYKILKNFDCV